jgi:hypothetical protein
LINVIQNRSSSGPFWPNSDKPSSTIHAQNFMVRCTPIRFSKKVMFLVDNSVHYLPLMIFSFLKMFLQKLNVDFSVLLSNFMAGDSIICNEYMSVWFLLGHGVKCCNLSAVVMNFNTCFSRWHKMKYDGGDEDSSLQGHEAV